jgi:hypothetical protein
MVDGLASSAPFALALSFEQPAALSAPSTGVPI